MSYMEGANASGERFAKVGLRWRGEDVDVVISYDIVTHCRACGEYVTRPCRPEETVRCVNKRISAAA